MSSHRTCAGNRVKAVPAVGAGCEHLFVRESDHEHPPGEATILHADLDAFYASVEQRDNPSLRGRPVIVGAGVVLAASYEARAFGIRTAIGGQEARRLCPQAIVVPPRFEAYTAASRAVFEIFGDTTPLVEGISIDEAFLDVGGLRRIAGSPVEIATRLRARVRTDMGLAITVGIERTKFLAEVASTVGKPDGLLEVSPRSETAFLHPLPVERLWGVGEVTAEKLHDGGVHTVGDVAVLGEAAMIALLGAAVGRDLSALASAATRVRFTWDAAVARSERNVRAVVDRRTRPISRPARTLCTRPPHPRR